DVSIARIMRSRSVKAPALAFASSFAVWLLALACCEPCDCRGRIRAGEDHPPHGGQRKRRPNGREASSDRITAAVGAAAGQDAPARTMRRERGSASRHALAVVV